MRGRGGEADQGLFYSARKKESACKQKSILIKMEQESGMTHLFFVCFRIEAGACVCVSMRVHPRLVSSW